MDLEKKYFLMMENCCKLMAFAGREVGHTCCGGAPQS